MFLIYLFQHLKTQKSKSSKESHLKLKSMCQILTKKTKQNKQTNRHKSNTNNFLTALGGLSGRKKDKNISYAHFKLVYCGSSFLVVISMCVPKLYLILQSKMKILLTNTGFVCRKKNGLREGLQHQSTETKQIHYQI